MRRAGGFSILEVLIALAIFAIAAVILGGAYVNVLNGYELANNALQRNEDVRFARQSLLAESDPEVIRRGGDFAGANGRTVRWRATLDPTETSDVVQVTFECEINGPDMKKAEKVTEVFRVLRPTWLQPVDREKIRQQNRDRITKITTGQGVRRI